MCFRRPERVARVVASVCWVLDSKWHVLDMARKCDGGGEGCQVVVSRDVLMQFWRQVGQACDVVAVTSHGWVTRYRERFARRRYEDEPVFVRADVC